MSKRVRIAVCIVSFAAICGCSPKASDPFETGFGSGVPPLGTDSGVASVEEGGEDESSMDGGGGPGGSGDAGHAFDLGVGDLPDANPEGSDPSCEKVDLLFVIDDSQSMEDEQAHLVASFPGFIEAMKDRLEGVDYHIGVTTSDAVPCNPEGCRTHGALVTQTCGANSSESVCGPFVEGNAYMTDGDDLATAFECAGRVGTAGDFDEKPMRALQGAIGADLNAPGACNDGFVRPDALLVVVIVTDEEDDEEFSCNAFDGSGGGPESWFDTVVAVKGGETNVAVLSLIGLPPPDDCPPKTCGVLNGSSDAEIAPRILDFTHRFTHSFTGRICEESYDAFFAEAIAVIDSACDDFRPRG